MQPVEELANASLFKNQSITHFATVEPFSSIIDIAEPRAVYGLSNSMQSKLMIAKANCIKRKIISTASRKMNKLYQHVYPEES